MKNDDTGREFCFAESAGQQKSVFRIVMYKLDKDWFVEVLNESWNFRDGTTRFVFEFDKGYALDLKGKSDGDALTYDFLELEPTIQFFSLIANGKTMRLKNSNDGFLDEFSLDGSGQAMEILAQCSGLK